MARDNYTFCVHDVQRISSYESRMHGWIKDRMKAMGITQGALATALGLPQPRISEIVGGRRRVYAEEAAIIANVLKMPQSEVLTLLSAKGETELSPTMRPIQTVPVISWVQAGEMAEISDPYPVGDADRWITIDDNRETLIALEVRGTSINRVVPPGNVIIVDYADTDLAPGKLYAIRNGENEGTVKRFKQNPDRFEPDSTEPHETIFMGPSIHIIGRVRKAVSDL